ncbi:MAG: carbon storage regulator [Burkholderiales bacterium]|nr:carbon storage regulator [Phycisphaerae bacterium]
MIVLSRAADESVIIGDDFVVTVLTIDDPRVELLIRFTQLQAVAERTVTLQQGQELHIGNDISVAVVDVSGDKARLGFEVPQTTAIHRKEVYEALHSAKKRAGGALFIAAAADQTIRIGKKLSLQVTDVDAGGVRVLARGELLGGAEDGKIINEAREIGPGSNLALGTQITITLVRVAGTLAHLSVVRPGHLRIEVA